MRDARRVVLLTTWGGPEPQGEGPLLADLLSPGAGSPQEGGALAGAIFIRTDVRQEGTVSYRRGRTSGFACPLCGGLIPGYSVYEKEVWEEGVLLGERVCDCGQYEEIRDVMLAVFHSSRVETLRRFREAAIRMRLPDPDA